MKLFIFILVLSFILKNSISSLEYGLFANTKNSEPITKLYVIGERCSGTNYINALLKKNFDLDTTSFGSPSDKHFPPWYELPIEYYSGDPRYYTFEGVDDCLFIVIFRNPYDWVRSFYLTPHQADRSLLRISFSNFIRMPWKFAIEPIIEKEYSFNPYFDRNPIDGSLFENVLKLRTAKIKTMLRIQEKAPNIYYLNYEIARDHSQEVLAEIANLFNLKPSGPYEPIIYRKDEQKQGLYKKKKYRPISSIDLAYINSQLDPEVENIINYTIKTKLTR